MGLTQDVKASPKVGESRQIASDSDIIQPIMQPQQLQLQEKQSPDSQQQTPPQLCQVDSFSSEEDTVGTKSPMHLQEPNSGSQLADLTYVELKTPPGSPCKVGDEEYQQSSPPTIETKSLEEHRQELEENNKHDILPPCGSSDQNESIQTTPLERRDSNDFSVLRSSSAEDSNSDDDYGSVGSISNEVESDTCVQQAEEKQRKGTKEETIPSMSLAMRLLQKGGGSSTWKSARELTATPMRLGFMLRRRCGSSGDIPRCRLDDEDEEEDNSMAGLLGKDRSDPLIPPFQEATGLRQRLKPIIQFTERNVPQRRPALLGPKRGSIRRSKWNRPTESQGLIPAEHPLKIIWDILTVVLSLANAYVTHTRIRDRKFGSPSPFVAFCDVWFLADILLNFATERKISDGVVLRDIQSVWARYLTSWFAIDVLSLMPWERLYIQPIIDQQNRRGPLQKYFFRSKAVVRVTTHLRGRHFKWFGQVAKRTKPHLGVGAGRLLRLIIKYAPKYVMFFRNMKGGVAVRLLRQVHWFRRFFYTTTGIKKNDKHLHHHKSRRNSPDRGDSETGSLTGDDEMDDLDENFSRGSMSFGDSRQANGGRGGKRIVQVVYNWEYVDDDEDDVPF